MHSGYLRHYFLVHPHTLLITLCGTIGDYVDLLQYWTVMADSFLGLSFIYCLRDNVPPT